MSYTCISSQILIINLQEITTQWQAVEKQPSKGGSYKIMLVYFQIWGRQLYTINGDQERQGEWDVHKNL